MTDEGEDEESAPSSPNRSELLWTALTTLPLMEDLFLGMQARNLAIVDDHLSSWELEVLRVHIDRERTPLPELMTLSAFSQLWVFGLYELLRTWRQRSRELLELHRTLQALPEEERRDRLEAAIRAGDSPSGILGLAQAAHRSRIERMNAQLATELESIGARLEPSFRRLEALRVTLAKHEIPKTKGIPALSPGYSRQNMLDGSLVWPVELKDGSLEMISRTEVVEDILSAILPQETK